MKKTGAAVSDAEKYAKALREQERRIRRLERAREAKPYVPPAS